MSPTSDTDRIVVLGTGGTIAGTAASPDDVVGYRAGQIGVDQCKLTVTPVGFHGDITGFTKKTARTGNPHRPFAEIKRQQLAIEAIEAEHAIGPQRRRRQHREDYGGLPAGTDLKVSRGGRRILHAGHPIERFGGTGGEAEPSRQFNRDH